MMSGHKKVIPECARQKGAAAVEFALIAMLFFALLIGIMEFGRVLFTWNSAAEATRRGARIAVVTDPASPATIMNEMRRIMPDLQNNQIEILYDGLVTQCPSNLCDYVTVSVGRPQPYSIKPLLLPIGSVTIRIPPFSTTLTREGLADH